MPRRLVLCLDGTWNTYKDQTNVSRLHAIIPNIPDDSSADQIQIKYYDEGVGTGQNDRIRGGAFGGGLAENIRQAYAWLSENYKKGSDVFIFGFSRGAYTARSLAGLISKCGIPNNENRRDRADQVKLAYKVYRDKSIKNKDDAAKALGSEFVSINIKFLGVWDTVGSLGVPTFNIAEKFHDTDLCENVENAYHAIAIDEHRKAYDVVLWTRKHAHTNMEQRWFPGAHANVGGGYDEDLLPDLSLRWMIDKAHACGIHLGIRNGIPLTPDYVLPLDGSEFRSAVRDSFREFAFGIYSLIRIGQRHYRSIGNTINESIDESAFIKWRNDSSYRPANLAHTSVDVALPALGELDAGGYAAEDPVI